MCQINRHVSIGLAVTVTEVPAASNNQALQSQKAAGAEEETREFLTRWNSRGKKIDGGT